MRIHNYQSDSGRDLIMEYIDSLTEDEREMHYLFWNVWKMKSLTEYFLKDGKRKYMRSILENIIEFFTLQ